MTTTTGQRGLGLRFTHNGHRYALDGDAVPSVTTVLNVIAKPALVGWAARQVAEAVADMPDLCEQVQVRGRTAFVEWLAAFPDQSRRKAALRGIDIHNFGQEIATRRSATIPADVADAVEGYANWLDAFGFVPAMTEVPVASRTYRYAGRFDLLGDTRDGTRWLLDVKTGRRVYGETALQLAAYACADFWVDEQGAEHRMPHIDKIGALHVSDFGTELYDLGDIDEAFTEFRAALALHNTQSRRRDLTRTPVQQATARNWPF